MPSLRDVVEAERSRLFVGREAELQHVTQWVRDPVGSTTVLFVWGMAGIGKSSLLSEMRRVARQRGAVCLWLDGSTCNQSPAAVLDFLDGLVTQADPTIAPTSVTRDPVDRLYELVENGGRRLLLIIDNYHDLARFGGWMREEVLGRLPDRGALVVLASRPAPSPGWTSDLAWRERIISLPLSPFSREEAYLLLTRLGVTDEALHEPILQSAAGLPLALSLLANSGGRVSEPAAWETVRSAPEGGARPAQAISAQLLREVTSPDLLPTLEALTMLSEADQDLLAEVLGEPIPPTRYHELSRLSFIYVTGSGVGVHGVAREHLLADMSRRSPDRFRSLRQRALVSLRRRLGSTSDRFERRRLSSVLLGLCRDALPNLEGYADLSVRPLLPAPSAFVPEDRSSLHGQLGRCGLGVGGVTEELAGHPGAHRFLDALMDQTPESIRVVRSPEGEPLAFTGLVLLHKESVELLREFHAGQIYLNNCARDELASLMVPRASADTYFLCMSGRMAQHLVYKPHEVVTAAYLDMLTVLGEGSRLLVLVFDPIALSFLRLLGFRVLPEYGTDGPPVRMELMELDLRRRDFGAWVDRFLQAMEGLSPTPSPEQGARSTPPSDISALAELRAVLPNLESPSRLDGTPLAQRLELSGPDLQKRILGLIGGPACPAPLTEDDQVVLRATYVEKHGGPEAIAMRLHLSRATYYRRLASAIANLAEALVSGPDGR